MDTMGLGQRVLVSGSDDYNTQMLYFTCSSLSADDRYIYLLSDRTGSPNVVVKDLKTGEERVLTDNRKGIMKSYVYFDGTEGEGFSKASVCQDPKRNMVYYIQDNEILCVGLDGRIRRLGRVPDGRMTAFTHVSADGRFLCVPMTDGRCLEYDPKTEGSGLDRRPVYDIDGRVQAEGLNSYLCVYDTQSGDLLYSRTIPECWITHVQFNPVDSEQILYNHEWSSFDCGIRRIWLYDHRTDTVRRVRTEGEMPGAWNRSRNDWVCHEMWSDDGNFVIYHGAYCDGPAFVGRADMRDGRFWEIALPEDYNAYGHFTMDHDGHLVCDGYFKFPGEIKAVRENSTDNGPDPHKKDGAYISAQQVDWERGILKWRPLCRHESDWLGQDAHPHPIYNHGGTKVYFSSRSDRTIKVYCVDCGKTDAARGEGQKGGLVF